MTVFRHSLLERVEECPQAAIRYARDDPGLYADALERGKLIHTCLAAYGRWCATRKVERDWAAMQAILRKVTGRVNAEILEDVEWCLNRFVERWEFEPEHPGLFEVPFGFTRDWKFDDGRDFRSAHFSGRIDQVVVKGDKLIVRDWKSDHWAPSEIRPRESRQIRRYGWAALHLPWVIDHGPINEISLEIVYIRSGWTVYDDVRMPVDLAYIPEELTNCIAVFEGLTDEGAEYRVSDHCAHCLWRTGCPRYLESGFRGSDTPPVTEADWSQFAQEHLLLKAKAGDMGKVLAKRLKQGTIPLAGGKKMMQVPSFSAFIKEPGKFLSAMKAKAGAVATTAAIGVSITSARKLAKSAGLKWEDVAARHCGTKTRNFLKVVDKDFEPPEA